MENQRSASLQAHGVWASQALVKDQLITLCPTLKLVAIADQHESVNVYRFDGQLAFSKKRLNDQVKVQCLCWKFDGKCLAIAWNNDVVEILSTDTGKILLNAATQTMWSCAYDPVQFEFHDFLGTEKPGIPSCLGWNIGFVDPAVVKAKTEDQPQTANDGTTELNTDNWDEQPIHLSLNDIIDRLDDHQRPVMDPQLPERLAVLDAEKFFPRLGVPPVASREDPRLTNALLDSVMDGVITSQASLDAVYQSEPAENLNTVNTLIICSTDGRVKPIIYDAMNLGYLDLPHREKFSSYKAILVVSHPFSCTHMLLVEASPLDKTKGAAQSTSTHEDDTSSTKLALVPLNLSAIHSAGTAMQLIASRVMQLQNLYYYLERVGRISCRLYQDTLERSRTLMNLLNEKAFEDERMSGSELLYQLAATGYCGDWVKEWIMDDVGEQGHKRWEQEVNSAYEKFIDALHENLLPGIERANIIACALRGLASYHDSNEKFNLDPDRFTLVLENLHSLRLIVHESLNYAVEERRQFLAFSAWLKLQIGWQKSESGVDSEEAADQGASIDYARVFKFIESELKHEKLGFFWKHWTEAHQEYVGGPISDLGGVDKTPDEVADIIEAIRGRQDASNDGELPFTFFCARLEERIKEATGRIGGWQLQMASMPEGLILEDTGKASVADMRMVYEQIHEAEQYSTYVAIVREEWRGEVRIHRVKHANEIDNMVKTVQVPDFVRVWMPRGRVKDVKFFDDQFIMVLFRTLKDVTYLFSIPYSKLISTALSDPSANPSNDSRRDIRTMLLPSGRAQYARAAIDLRKRENFEQYVLHAWPRREHFDAVTLAINGRKDREVVCVLEEDKRRFRILNVGSKQAERQASVPLDDDEDTPMSGSE